MSDIAVTSNNQFEYNDIHPSLVSKSTIVMDDTTYPAYAFSNMGYVAAAPITQQYQQSSYFNERQQPNSPESISSSHPSTPPTNDLVTPLSNPTTARVKEMITRANSVPMEFYHTEFLEYSKETYEKKMESKRNKRRRTTSTMSSSSKKQKVVEPVEEEYEEDEDEEDQEAESSYKSFSNNPQDSTSSNAEIRRQIHIQSEQKRRAQIKDGFDELRKHLPGCNNKKMSKAALLTRTVQQLQHLKNMQTELLSEVERLLQENEQLKRFQHGVLQRQAMEKMYAF